MNTIHFQFEGKNYEVAMDTYPSKDIKLPDGRILQVSKWLETFPYQIQASLLSVIKQSNNFNEAQSHIEWVNIQGVLSGSLADLTVMLIDSPAKFPLAVQSMKAIIESFKSKGQHHSGLLILNGHQDWSFEHNGQIVVDFDLMFKANNLADNFISLSVSENSDLLAVGRNHLHQHERTIQWVQKVVGDRFKPINS